MRSKKSANFDQYLAVYPKCYKIGTYSPISKFCVSFPLLGTNDATHFKSDKRTEPGKCQSKYDKLRFETTHTGPVHRMVCSFSPQLSPVALEQCRWRRTSSWVSCFVLCSVDVIAEIVEIDVNDIDGAFVTCCAVYSALLGLRESDAFLIAFVLLQVIFCYWRFYSLSKFDMMRNYIKSRHYTPRLHKRWEKTHEK